MACPWLTDGDHSRPPCVGTWMARPRVGRHGPAVTPTSWSVPRGCAVQPPCFIVRDLLVDLTAGPYCCRDMNSPPSSPPAKMLSWQQAPFDRFVDYTKQAHRLLHLTIHGIQILSTRDELVDKIQDYDAVVTSNDLELDVGKKSPEQVAELDQARSEAAFARTEIENDFPKLRAHSLVDLWGALEVLVEDVLAAWLTHSPELLSRNEIARLRVPFGEFQRLEGEERSRFLVQELSRDRKADLKGGVTRFEILLDIVGLGGEVRDSLRRDIWEAHQVRNSIAHRTGLVDRRLLTACPWITLRIGEPVPLHAAIHERYEIGIISYAFVIFNRVRLGNGLMPIEIPAYGAESDAEKMQDGPAEEMDNRL
jgi:hypothetical protein